MPRGPTRPPDEVVTLHRKLRALLCARIYQGEYSDGARLPPEREFAAQLGMSRVTVRTALAALEAEGLLDRRQGHGTRLTLRTGGYASALDLVAVIAPVQNPFFSSFLQGFELAAEAEGALVVVKQTAGRRKVEALLFEFFTRDIRNAVIWPYAERLDDEALRRLRGLGMNLVFFDHVPGSPAADAVSVYNGHAVATLLGRLRERGSRAPCFLGWDRAELTSNVEREAAFVAQEGPGRVVRLPWRSEVDVEVDVAAALARLPAGTDGLLCGNGGIGIAAQRLVDLQGRSLPVVCVDDLPGAEAMGLDAYAQPMEGLANLVWKRLFTQNRSSDDWKARTMRLRGELLVRTGSEEASEKRASPSPERGPGHDAARARVY